MTEPSLPPFVEPLGHGIYAIDTGFQRPAFAAAYLVVERGRAAFIDTGTALAVPRHLAALAALGIAREAVDWIIPTHVHLDHAGATGQLAQALPHATVLVHPRGAPHLVDPRALYDGALQVYGAAEMARSYGTLVPVPAARVQASADGQTIELAGRPLQLADTPGHARHHHCVWDAASAGWFTGDTFGLSYREFDGPAGAFALPTTTPVQFDPEPLKASIGRLVAAQPRAIYLTHYGRLGEPARHAARLVARIDELVAAAHALREHPARHAALKAAFAQLAVRWAADDRVPVPAAELLAGLELDLELNAQGIGVWLDRAARGR